MFYVSISKEALQKVERHAKSKPNKEVIGVLIGKMENHTLIIEDAVTGKIKSGITRAEMPPETIAKIADDIIKKRIKGNVVGWYHSHPGYGLFLSDLDISTQAKLQQFSPHIVALVIDPSTDEAGFFTLDIQTKSPIPIRNEYVHTFAPGEEPVPPYFVIAPPTYPSPRAPETPPFLRPYPRLIPEGPPLKKPFYRNRSLMIVVVVWLLTTGCLVVPLYFAITPPIISDVKINEVEPWEGPFPANNITISASVTAGGIGAGVRDVTLYYILENGSENSIQMTSSNGKFYNCTIPSEKVTANMTFCIEAKNIIGSVARSKLYNIKIFECYGGNNSVNFISNRLMWGTVA